MTRDLKKRITTSLFLLLALSLSYINNFILGYILIVAAIFSILEFLQISKIIFNKKKIKKFWVNLIFIVYIFYFFLLFLTFSTSLYLKILIFVILLTCVASDIGGFVFGKVIKGMEFIDMIKKGESNSGSVTNPDKIISVKSK